jgi:hypothetical protein
MRKLLILATTMPLVLVNTWVEAHNYQLKRLPRNDQFMGSCSVDADQLRGGCRGSTLSDRNHSGLVNGEFPGAARKAGDTQSN